MTTRQPDTAKRIKDLERAIAVAEKTGTPAMLLQAYRVALAKLTESGK